MNQLDQNHKKNAAAYQDECGILVLSQIVSLAINLSTLPFASLLIFSIHHLHHLHHLSPLHLNQVIYHRNFGEDSNC